MRGSDVIMVWTRVLLPLCGPSVPDGSMTSCSRSWSKGRSTIPTGIFSVPWSGYPAAIRPRSGWSARPGSSSSSGDGRSSGGSHTCWASSPSSTIRSTATDRSVSCSFLGLRLGSRFQFGIRCAARHDPAAGPRCDLTGHPRLVRAAATPAVGPRDVGGAEAAQGLHSRLHGAGTRLRRQLVGVRHPQHSAALHRGEGAQAAAVRQVTLQLVRAAPRPGVAWRAAVRRGSGPAGRSWRRVL